MTLGTGHSLFAWVLLGATYVACSDDAGDRSTAVSGASGSSPAESGAAGSMGRSGVPTTSERSGVSSQSGGKSSSGTSGKAGSGASGKASTGATGKSSSGMSGASASVTSGSAESGAQSGQAGCGRALLCDDFEGAAAGGPPDPQMWSLFTTPNVPGPERRIAVDDSVAHSGSRSVLSDGQGGAARFFGITSLPEGIGDTVYVRLWIRFSRALGVGHAQYVVLNSNGDFNTGKELRLAGQEKLVKWTDIPSDHSLPNVWVAKDKSISPEPGEWTCFEFGVDTVKSTISFWINDERWPGLEYQGAEVAGVTDQFHPWTAFAFTHVGFGWRGFGDGEPMQVWYDDIAIGGEHIGCR